MCRFNRDLADNSRSPTAQGSQVRTQAVEQDRTPMPVFVRRRETLLPDDELAHKPSGRQRRIKSYDRSTRTALQGHPPTHGPTDAFPEEANRIPRPGEIGHALGADEA
jgi:hypothetical protein